MCLSNYELKSSYFSNFFIVVSRYFKTILSRYNTLAIAIKQLSYQVDINFHQKNFMHFFSLYLFHYFVLLLLLLFSFCFPNIKIFNS
jgi:hypothetical protein